MAETKKLDERLNIRRLCYTDTRWGPMIFPHQCPWTGYSIAAMGEYSPVETDLLQLLSDKNSISVDVGANIGVISMALSFAAKRVISFEPVDFTYDLLQANIAMCKRKNISAYNLAATEVEKLLVTNGNEDDPKKDLGSVSLIANPKGSILGKPLDEILYRLNTPIALIKLDIEGGEADALQGCENTIKKHQPYIFFEAIDEEKGMRAVNILKEHGYEMRWFVSLLYHQDNWKGEKTNPWELTSSFNILAWPKAKELEFMPTLPTLDKVEMGTNRAHVSVIVRDLGPHRPDYGS